MTLIDYKQRAPRTSRIYPNGEVEVVPLRSHDTVLARADQAFLDIPAMVSRIRGDNGADWFADKIRDLEKRRKALAKARSRGDGATDSDAEELSFRNVGDLPGLQRALDFDVVVKVPGANGAVRAVTTSAFSLLASSMAVADVNMAYEGVPTVAERLVQDIDDIQPNTEIGQPLDFGHTPPGQAPKPLGETEEYHEANAVDEDRYTVLSFKDGYQRVFSQEVIERSAPKVFQQLSDLGSGCREILEYQALLRIIDFYGSRASSASWYVMERNRAGAALFSSSVNKPDVRAPKGTRINNNAFADGTALSKLRVQLAAMTNARGYPVVNWPEKILIPDALWEVAFTTIHSMLVPGEFNAMNFWGPNGPGGPVEVISTPMLDVIQGTATTPQQSWYGGRPQRQFVRKWKQRPEVAVHGGRGTEAFTRTREGMRVRIGWDMLIGARDYVFWVENLPSTTPPGN